MILDAVRWDATEQAERIRRREVTPLELVQTSIARIERLDPELNAVILPAFEQALAEARQIDSRDSSNRPFWGVPFLMKDLGGIEAGRPCHMGMRALKDAGWIEPQDAYLTQKLRSAGFISLGRTNTPELGLLPTTEPMAYGPTRNPWSTNHSSGGSSGGSSAAVAAGYVAAAHASDGGGSIRIPAAHCGLVGLKPTRGRNSFGPFSGERWGGFSCEHVVSKSVRDCAAILDVTAGPMPGDPYFAAPPDSSFLAALDRKHRPLRIGVLDSAPRTDIEMHPDCRAAVQRAAGLLAESGHVVELAYPHALSEPESVQRYVNVVACSTARVLDVVGAKLGRTLTEADVEPLTWALANLGRSRSATDYLETIEAIHAFSRRVAAWWESGFDLLLSPTTAQPPPQIGELACPPDAPLAGFIKSAPFGVFTSPFNLTGQPGISLPIHWTDAGMPIGVQLVAAFGREDLLLQVASQLEAGAPWKDHVSPFVKR